MSHSGLRALVLLGLLLTGAVACTQRELVGAVGDEVTFRLCTSLREVYTVVWTFNSTSLISLQSDTVIVSQKHKAPRVNVTQGYSLCLSRLELGDTGAYRVELHSSDKTQPDTQDYTLRVYERLSRPTVTGGQCHTEDGIWLVNVSCSALQGAEVTYSWEGPISTHEGPVLPISWRPGSSDAHFTCVASNPVSNSSSHPVSAKEICEGAADQLGFSLGLLLSLIVLLCCAPVALLTVVLRLRRQSPQAPTGKTTGMKTCRHGTHHSALSDPVTPMENPVSTLYSTVQIPKKVDKATSLPEGPPQLFVYDNII